MRCKVCKDKFDAKFFNQKTCLNPECILEYSKEVKLKEWDKQSKKANKPTTIKKKSVKEYLQTDINKLSRMIDGYFNYNCIDCDNPFNKSIHGAHFHNVGGNENIRFNLHNIHASRSYCNVYNSEHKKGYVIGLEKRYSYEYLQYVDKELSIKYSYLGLNETELKEALKNTRKCIREFEELIKGFNNGKDSREFFNKKIGIYK